MHPLHTLALRMPLFFAVAFLGIGVFAGIASAVEPGALRGGSRIGAIDPILGATGILMMTIGLTVMGVTRLRFAPRPMADLPGRSVVLQRQAPQVQRHPRPPSPGAALIDALAATSEALDELAESLPRRRRQRISHAAHRVATARALLEAHNTRR
jgi:hypothetical protein